MSLNKSEEKEIRETVKLQQLVATFIAGVLIFLIPAFFLVQKELRAPVKYINIFQAETEHGPIGNKIFKQEIIASLYYELCKSYPIAVDCSEKEYFITSADFMERNLDKRIEVGTIVEDPEVQGELEKLFDFQWRGSVKARLIDEQMRNHYRRNDLPPFHAQEELYHYYKRLEDGFLGA
jgi:hypothetical protein